MINLVTFPLGFGAAFALRRYKDGLRAENLAVVKVSFTGTYLENDERIQFVVQNEVPLVYPVFIRFRTYLLTRTVRILKRMKLFKCLSDWSWHKKIWRWIFC